ncbi:MAG TPA: helix-turn-helix domain-containing protein [Planctomycetota bacterium]
MRQKTYRVKDLQDPKTAAAAWGVLQGLMREKMRSLPPDLLAPDAHAKINAWLGELAVQAQVLASEGHSRQAMDEYSLEEIATWYEVWQEAQKRKAAPKESNRWTRPYSVSELAHIFQVSRNTMSSYLRTNQVHGRKVGSRWQVQEDEMPQSDDLHKTAQKR